MLFSQEQEVLNNYSARNLITLNMRGTHEIRDAPLWSVRAQNMDTTGYKLSDLEETEFRLEDLDLNMDWIFGPGIDPPFSRSTCIDFQIGSETESPNLIDEVEDNENSHPTTLVTEKPTRPVALVMRLSFKMRKKLLLIIFIEVCFNKYHCV